MGSVNHDVIVWGSAFLWLFLAWLITMALFSYQADDLLWNIKYNQYCVFLVTCLVSLQVLFHGILLLIAVVAFSALTKMVVLDYFEIDFPEKQFENALGFVCQSKVLYTMIAVWLMHCLLSFYLTLFVYSKETTGLEESVLAERAKVIVNRQLAMFMFFNMIVCCFFAVRAFKIQKTSQKINVKGPTTRTTR
jgi:hypothetical protein